MPRTRLIFVSGKGGTGKSAVTAAIAIDHQRHGHKVLVIDMIGGPGLAAHLGAPSLAYAPLEVRRGLFAIEMNRSEALDEYLRTQLHLPRNAATKQISNALSVLADTAPGVREIISIGKPVYEAWKGIWDVVVVDASSLGQFQSYLRAPRAIASLVPTGRIRHQSASLEETLLDPDVTSIYLVTTASELPIVETSAAIETIADEAIGPQPSVIINRLVPPSGMARQEVEDIKGGALRDAAVLQLDLEAEQDVWSDQLDHAIELPYLFGVLTPGEIAVQLADEIRDAR